MGPWCYSGSSWGSRTHVDHVEDAVGGFDVRDEDRRHSPIVGGFAVASMTCGPGLTTTNSGGIERQELGDQQCLGVVDVGQQHRLDDRRVGEVGGTDATPAAVVIAWLLGASSVSVAFGSSRGRPGDRPVRPALFSSLRSGLLTITSHSVASGCGGTVTTGTLVVGATVVVVSATVVLVVVVVSIDRGRAWSWWSRPAGCAGQSARHGVAGEELVVREACSRRPAIDGRIGRHRRVTAIDTTLSWESGRSRMPQSTIGPGGVQPATDLLGERHVGRPRGRDRTQRQRAPTRTRRGRRTRCCHRRAGRRRRTRAGSRCSRPVRWPDP
jgi:hypothetical protein